MKFNQGMGHRIGRALSFFWFAGLEVFFLLLGLSCFQEGSPEGILCACFFLVFEAIWLWLSVLVFCRICAVTLTPEGVCVRMLLKKRFYPWDGIVQAGVLRRYGKGQRYDDFVLLREGGSPRLDEDRSFAWRNEFRLIHLPDDPQARAFVIRHYGPLDFDQSDPEKFRDERI